MHSSQGFQRIGIVGQAEKLSRRKILSAWKLFLGTNRVGFNVGERQGKNASRSAKVRPRCTTIKAYNRLVNQQSLREW